LSFFRHAFSLPRMERSAHPETVEGPDVVLFDVMGTLVHDPFFKEMPEFFGLSLRELIDAKHPNAWVRFEHGELTPEELLVTFFADRRAFDHAAFVEMLRGSYRWLDGIEPILRALAERDVAMHTLSNYPCWYRLIEESVELSRYVAWTFVSCETGLRKPDEEAYRHAARTLGVDPERCLFVDDREVNCAGARAIGMDSIVFADASQLRRELERRSLL
jgi:HAD superfamily hydrolase (TIGR01509 family)